MRTRLAAPPCIGGAILDTNGNGDRPSFALLQQLETAVREIGIKNLLRAIAAVAQARADELEKAEPLLGAMWSGLATDLIDLSRNLRGIR